MYGLKQAVILAYKQIKERLNKEGYAPIIGTTGLWKHATRKIVIALCVDDFGLEYFNKEDVEHLTATLGKYYKISTDWEGKNCCGLTLDWSYKKVFVDMSMPGYVKKALEKYQHKKTASLSMRLINGTSLCTDKKCSTLRQKILLKNLTKKALKEYSQFQVHSSSMSEQ